jgi:DNA invertase Pin-like site-specific DNA recombinase
MVGILAELERSLIQERTKAGRAAAVARGVKMGRKVKLTPQQVAHAQKLIEQGEHHDTVAKSLGVSRRTLYRWLEKTRKNVTNSNLELNIKLEK